MEDINTNAALAQHCHEAYKNKFANEQQAKRYSSRHTFSAKGKREMACIKKALASVKQHSLILDLPCGTGRLTSFIKGLEFQVIGADGSAFMLEEAKRNEQNKDITFEQQDVLAIQYPDNMFAAVVCNRLFHHYPIPELRRLALVELARVTEGPIIVSFFNSYSLSACWTKLKNKLRNKNPTDRVAISFFAFKEDIEAAGLKIVASYYSRFGLSPQMYVKLVKK